MVKGLTLVTRVASDPVHRALAGLLSALGFEPGKGWQDGQGRGAAFLAPLGNLEIVTGRLPGDGGLGDGTPALLVEVAHIEQVRQIALEWLGRNDGIGGEVSEIGATHWNSRLFRLSVAGEEIGRASCRERL